MKNLTILFIFAFAIGCSSVPMSRTVNFGLSSYVDPEQLETIAVIPFIDNTQTSTMFGASVQQEVTNEFIVQLVKLDRFKLVDPAKVKELVFDENGYLLPITQELISEIGDTLEVDGVIIGSVIKYQSPTKSVLIQRTSSKVGVQIRLVATDTSTTLWIVNETFDGKEKEVQQLASGNERSRIKNDITLLTQILCREIVQTLDI